MGPLAIISWVSQSSSCCQWQKAWCSALIVWGCCGHHTCACVFVSKHSPGPSHSTSTLFKHIIPVLLQSKCPQWCIQVFAPEPVYSDLRQITTTFSPSCIQSLACKGAFRKTKLRDVGLLEGGKKIWQETIRVLTIELHCIAGFTGVWWIPLWMFYYCNRCSIAAKKKKVSLLSYKRWVISAADQIDKAPFIPGVCSEALKNSEIRLTKITRPLIWRQ